MLLSLFELAAVVLIIIGLLNEGKLIAFEDRILKIIKAYRRRARKRRTST
jgi:hypothetical protein